MSLSVETYAQAGRSNMIAQTRDLSGCAKFGTCTITQDTLGTLDPVGTNKATLLAEEVNTNPHGIYAAAYVLPTVAGRVYCGSMFVKSYGGRRYVMLVCGRKYTNSNFVTFDFQTGAITPGGGDGYGFRFIGDGWWLAWLWYLCPQSQSEPLVVSARDSAAGWIGVGYTGDVNKGVYVYGPKVERDARYPSLFVPSNGVIIP